MSDQQTTPLAVGQVWKPKRGKPRRIINIPRTPGVHFVTEPDGRTGHCLGSIAFREWIARYGVELQEPAA